MRKALEIGPGALKRYQKATLCNPGLVSVEFFNLSGKKSKPIQSATMSGFLSSPLITIKKFRTTKTALRQRTKYVQFFNLHQMPQVVAAQGGANFWKLEGCHEWDCQKESFAGYSFFSFEVSSAK